MASEWKSLPIADAPMDIIDGDRGANYPKQADFSRSGHCLFLNTGNVTTSGFNFSERSFVSVEKDAELRKGKLQRYDVVLTTRGTVGNAALFDDFIPFEHMRINSGMVLLRADRTKILPNFLYQFVRSESFRNQVAALTTGSAQPQLPIRDIRRVQIPFPPLPEQKAIARILGTLDDKIELNRRMNATLEAMARALFQSWFVDFEPVRRKSEKREVRSEKTESSSLSHFSLPTSHFDSLFPASFQDSILGEIPTGWRIGKISELTEFSRSSVNPGNFPDETFDHYSLPAFDEGRQPKAEAGTEIKSNKLTVTPDAVLLSKLNPHIPRIWLPKLSDIRRSVCSTEFLVARPTSQSSQEYLFALFTSSRFSTAYSTLVTGTTGSHQRIKADAVQNLDTVIPPEKLVAAFTAFARPLFARINQNITQSRTLATLRDALLPKLLSGEFSIPECKSKTTEVLA